MAATTTLLGLVTPTQGTLSGTWGDTVNYGISDYVDIAIAGTLSFAGDDAITLANTTGSSAGNGITSTTAQYMIIRVTGTQTVTKVITGPSYSKLYMVDHAGATSAVTFKASGQTGVSIAVGEKAVVYYNGTDYVKAASSVVSALTGTLPVANGGTSLTTLTANNVILGNGTSTPLFVAPSTSGNVLTSNGTTWSSSAPAAGGITYTAVKVANYTAVANDGVQTNTTSGAFTVTLPATPSNGNQVFVVDSFNTWGTNNLTIGRNGSTIEGVAQDLVCDITGVSVQCVYNGTTWDIFAQVGGAGGSVVSGPASSTDNAIARFDATTGKIIQNSVVTIADTTGNVAGVGTLSLGTTLGVGAATPSASGSGITFPATQSASSDANTLDDYEEGSFTFTGTGFTTTPTKTAYYTKIGNQVTIRIPDITGTSNTTLCTITGLPVAIRSDSSFVSFLLVYNNSTGYNGHIYGGGTNTIQVHWDAGESAFTASVIKGIINYANFTYTIV